MKLIKSLLAGILLVIPCRAAIKAQYKWGYVGPEGQGKGLMNVLVEVSTGQVVLELQGLGERMMLLSGDRANGYRVQIPRNGVDQNSLNIESLPLPFLPNLRSVQGLENLLRKGTSQGVDIAKRDSHGPIKLHYLGKNEHGKEIEIWLDRTHWSETDPAN